VKHHVSFSGGKDSTAMLLRMLEDDMPVDDIVFFDTGWEFPAMLEHIERVEEYTGRTVTRLTPKYPFAYWMLKRPIVARSGERKGEVHRHGNGWPSAYRRWCTREKVAKLDKHNKDAVRYIGIAADEASRMTSLNLAVKDDCRYPLVDWGMTEDDCMAYCRDRGFDWGGLYDHFRRVSCFCCPLQPLRELRTLRKHFPDLWAQMLEWDANMPDHNQGFHHYQTVRDLERRFANEDLQMKFSFTTREHSEESYVPDK